MPTLTLEVEVPDLDPDAFREAVLRAAVDRVLGVTITTKQDPETGETWEGRNEAAFKALRQSVQEAIEQRVQQVVEQRVPVVVDEVLAQEFTPMNRWGERAPKATTIRAMIGEYAERWLTESVNRRDGGTGYSDGGKVPRLHYLIIVEVESAFKAHLSKVATDAAHEVKAQLAGKVSTEISDTVRRLLGLPPAAK